MRFPVSPCSRLLRLTICGDRLSHRNPRRVFSPARSSIFTAAASMAVDVGGMRKDYPGQSAAFDVADLAAREPIAQFHAWFEEAKRCPGVEEANAMCLATADARGVPSARVVLMKEFGPEGFVFFTNYDSRKGRELAANPHAALVFYWEPQKRSVRVEGAVQKVSEEQSRKYFDSRPLGSKIGAVASNQSNVIKDKNSLMERVDALQTKYSEGGSEGPTKPDCWGGFRVVPAVVEFWQGRHSRLHDRLRFRRRGQDEKEGAFVEGDDGWVIERLEP